MEIGPFPSECVCGNHTLGLELVVTHGTTKLYLTQRCHGRSLPRYGTREKKEREYLCHDFEFLLEEIGLVGTLGRLYLLASQKRDRLPTRELVVDAHQPTA
jgi:hypothetical protein